MDSVRAIVSLAVILTTTGVHTTTVSTATSTDSAYATTQPLPPGDGSALYPGRQPAVHVDGEPLNTVHKLSTHAGWHCGSGELVGVNVTVTVSDGDTVGVTENVGVRDGVLENVGVRVSERENDGVTLGVRENDGVTVSDRVTDDVIVSDRVIVGVVVSVRVGAARPQRDLGQRGALGQAVQEVRKEVLFLQWDHFIGGGSDFAATSSVALPFDARDEV